MIGAIFTVPAVCVRWPAKQGCPHLKMRLPRTPAFFFLAPNEALHFPPSAKVFHTDQDIDDDVFAPCHK
jgi:hypothetical protein